MTPRLVTFDAAGTLVQVHWSPAVLAAECLDRLHVAGSEECGVRFGLMLRERWPAYLAVNQLRSEEEGDRFWERLSSDWLDEIGQPQSLLDPFRTAFWDALYGPDQAIFGLYDDVVSTLERLRRDDVSLAVISNWDYSLHRILKMLGIYDRFSYVIASLEEGFEKPDPRIFELALSRFGVEPGQALHVGDHPTDDQVGAESVGMRALLVDRARSGIELPFIPSLKSIWETDVWTS